MLRWLGREYAEKARSKGWYPQTQAQFDALCNPADLLMLGGTLGSLKTSTLLVDLVQERDSPRMMSYFFRRTYPALEDAMRQAYMVFSQTGGRWNGQEHTWRWPSGAMFRFRQCKNDKELYDNMGKELSAIGIDQSEQFPEDYVRFLMSRNRSVDRDLLIRTRLGANPGGEGGAWHMDVFFNGVCPHCDPHRAPGQGVIRKDARWHSDAVPIGVTVAYVLSTVRDHNLLGDDYIRRVQMQHPSTAKALLDGCWKTFEGQYFDIWDAERMIVKRQTAPISWWHAAWVGADYGYSGSAAAAVLCARGEAEKDFPQGRIFVLDEYPSDSYGIRREPVRDFAHSVYDKLCKKQEGQAQARRIEAMYLGPDSWNDRGDLHTLAGQMDEVLERHGLAWSKADNDRAGGAQLLYSLFQTGELVICDSCPNTIRAIESRIKDEKEPVKVKKVPTDPGDDYFDAVRYGVYSYHQRAMKPYQMRVEERIDKVWKEEDPTTAMLQLSRIQDEEREKEPGQATYYGGNIRQRLAEEARKGRR